MICLLFFFVDLSQSYILDYELIKLTHVDLLFLRKKLIFFNFIIQYKIIRH